MAVGDVITLPAQPVAGDGVLYSPLGGDGRSAPLAVYDIGIQVVGDAGGGNAVVTVNFDPRYTSLVAWVAPFVAADTAATEFFVQLVDTVLFTPNLRIVGTMPFVTEGFSARNSSYLWFPPPMWFNGNGQLNANFVNVDATETYGMNCSIYVFDRNVRQIQAAQWLNMTKIGVNSPTAT